MKRQCITCNKIKVTKDGVYDEKDNILQCKECVLEQLRCTDCSRPTSENKRLVFAEGQGEYYALCYDCLNKSHSLLCLLKEQKKKSCKKLVKKAWEIVDNLADQEDSTERQLNLEKAKEKDEREAEMTEKEKTVIMNGCDILLSVTAETLILGGRDNCQEHLKFQTDNYDYEFIIGCHNAELQYIDIDYFHWSITIDFYHNANDGESKVYIVWKGRQYAKMPEWLPMQALIHHYEAIIAKLAIKKCEQWH